MKRIVVMLLVVAAIFSNVSAQTTIGAMPVYSGSPSGAFVPIVIGGANKKYDLGNLVQRTNDSLNVVVKYRDTAAMLLNYRNAINARLRIADTSGMLAAYQAAINAKLRIADTSGMLAAYQAAINARLRISDTASMLLPYRNAINTNTNNIATKQNQLSGTGFVKISGTTISYDNTSYLPIIGGDLTGTGGNGYHGYVAQSAAPSTPSSGFRLYATSTNALAWVGQNGYRRIFDGTANTSDQTYTLPNASGTLPLLSLAQTWTANQSIANGSSFQSFNTSDQITNYERVRNFWTGNAYFLQSEKGGTGSVRNLNIGVPSNYITVEGAGTNILIRDTYFYTNSLISLNNYTFSVSGIATYSASGSSQSNAHIFKQGGVFNASSGSQNFSDFYPNINQSGTAGYTGHRVAAYEQATGSGTKRLQTLGTTTAANGGGTYTEQFGVNNNGHLFQATGTNKASGTATLSSGTVTVNTTEVTASSFIWVQYQGAVSTVSSILTTPTITAGTSFVITALTPGTTTTATTDNNTVKWWIIN